jgi:serine/threonine-protein kinase
MYMAPELSRGARVASPASDIYGLGLIAYQLLSREFPPVERHAGRGDTLQPRPLGVLCPAIPAELAGMLDRCLGPAPEERPAIALLVAALEASSGGRAASDQPEKIEGAAARRKAEG